MQENHSSPVQWRKILIVSGLSLLVLAFLAWNLIFIQRPIIKQAENSYSQEQIYKTQAILSEIQQECQAVHETIVQDPLVTEALLKAHLQKSALSIPTYSNLQKKYACNSLQLLSAQGLVRWSPDKLWETGKDLRYERIVLTSLLEKGKLNTLVFENENLNLVSTVPLFNEEKYIGVSKLCISFSQALQRKLPEKRPGHYAVFQLNGIQRNLIWETQKSQVVLNTNDIKRLQQGEAFYRSTQDKKTILLLIPLKDADHITIAYLQREIPRQLFVEARTNNLLFFIIITILTLIAMFLMLHQEGLSFFTATPESADLQNHGKISRVSIRMKAVSDDIEDEKADKTSL